MAGNRNKRTVSILSVLIITTTVAGFGQRRASYIVDPDIPRIETGAEGGSISREIELGAAYLTGRGVARDEKQAARWYEKAANSGDPAAQEEIGYFYQAGIGVERDPARAAQWFERAVAGGLISAKVNLGVAYVWGLGVRKDPAFAVQLFREAAKKGSGMGACYLGDMYYFGVGVPKSESDARHWFEVGSKLHNIAAKSDLALLLLHHPDKDSQDRAIRLLREASSGGSVAAKHQLGLEMIRMPEFSRSSNEAIKLLEEAAFDGYWKSSAALGVLSRDGKAVAKDNKVAYYHFRVAALQGGEKAATVLAKDIKTLTSQLEPAQVLEVDQEAKVWVQKHNRSLDFVNLHNDFANSFPAFALEHSQNDIHAALLMEAPDTEATP
jgi:TPR repeat protein